MKPGFPLTISTLLAACAAPPTDGGRRELVFYPEAPAAPRMQFLRTIVAEAEIEPPKQTTLDTILFGEQPSTPIVLTRPSAVAVRDRAFLVTDTVLQGIVLIDLEKRVVDLADLQGRARLIQPIGLCVGPEGEVYVADGQRQQVVVLDRDFGWVREFGPWEPDSRPVDVKIWQDRLVVADSGAGCVRVLSLPSGEPLHVLGKVERPGEFLKGPAEVAVDADGFIYVADTIYCNLLVWDPDGNPVGRLAQIGDGPGFLGRPKGITIYDDLIFLLDSRFGNCQIFDKAGTLHGVFGSYGHAPGQMDLPRKIWIGRENVDLFADYLDPDFEAEAIIAVTNTYGPKLSFYAWGKHKKFTYNEVELPKHPAPPPPAAPAAAGTEPRK